jgi:hypothetical protein
LHFFCSYTFVQATGAKHTGRPDGAAAPDGRKEEACDGREGVDVCGSAELFLVEEVRKGNVIPQFLYNFEKHLQR